MVLDIHFCDNKYDILERDFLAGPFSQHSKQAKYFRNLLAGKLLVTKGTFCKKSFSDCLRHLCSDDFWKTRLGLRPRTHPSFDTVPNSYKSTKFHANVLRSFLNVKRAGVSPSSCWSMARIQEEHQIELPNRYSKRFYLRKCVKHYRF